ncbi:MAG: DUF308 domain-containing protein, partial [Bullifex sp.]
MKLNRKYFLPVLGLCEAAIGILLLISPVRFTKIILISAGILLLAAGIYKGVSYFRTSPEKAEGSNAFVLAMLLVLFGIFMAFDSEGIMKSFPFTGMIYGLGLLLTGLLKVQWMTDRLRLHRKNWYFMAVSAGISLVAFLLILINPFPSMSALWICTGILFIAAALADVSEMII